MSTPYDVAKQSRITGQITRAGEVPGITAEPAAHGHAPYAAPDDKDPVSAALAAVVQLARIPFAGEEILKRLDRITHLLSLDTAADVFANSADASNLTPSAFGASFTAPVFATYTRTAACVVRNIFVGASGAGVVQIVKAQGADNAPLISATAQPFTVVGTVRILAGLLGVSFPGAIVVPQGWQLHLISSTNVNLDFSCDYRYLRGE